MERVLENFRPCFRFVKGGEKSLGGSEVGDGMWILNFALNVNGWWIKLYRLKKWAEFVRDNSYK